MGSFTGTNSTRPTSRIPPAAPINGVFLLLFAVTYLILYVAYSAVPDALLRDHVYYYAIVAPAKAMIDLVAPNDHVMGEHNVLNSATVKLTIVRGCDSAGVIFLLMAAVIAVRASLKRTLLGIAGAMLVIYPLNQLRIVTLYFVAAHRISWFTAVHVYFIPTLMILAGVLYFAAWASRLYDIEYASRH
jgi:exosortase family protein XrtM